MDKEKIQNIIGSVLSSVAAITIATALLVLFTILRATVVDSIFGNPNYVDFDFAGYINTALIIASHVAAFTVAIWISRRSNRRNESPARTGFLEISIAVTLIFWRFIGIGISHLDCGNDCVTNIPPYFVENTISVIIIGLFLAIGVKFIMTHHDEIEAEFEKD